MAEIEVLIEWNTAALCASQTLPSLMKIDYTDKDPKKKPVIIFCIFWVKIKEQTYKLV